IDIVFNVNKDSEVSYRTDRSVNLRPNRTFLSQSSPRIISKLLQPKADALLSSTYFKHYRFNIITNIKQLRWMMNLLSPTHLRNVDQSFNSLVQTNKGTVVCKANDLAVNLSSWG